MPALSEKERQGELDRLYAAPLEEFVKLRNDLAKRLRQQGQAEEAIEVAALKKPSVSAWIVNQVVRSNEVEVRRLIKAGEALEKAQRETVSGRRRGDFDASRREEAESLRRLRAAIKEVAPSVSPAVLERALGTLRAGAVTGEGRQHLQAGRLTVDLEPPGFDVFAGLASAPSSSPAPEPVSKRTEQLRQRLEAAQADLALKLSEADEMERQAKEAERIAKDLARVAATTRKQAEQAADQVRRLQGQLEGQ